MAPQPGLVALSDVTSTLLTALTRAAVMRAEWPTWV